MYYLLFIFYLALACFIMTRITFTKNAGLSSRLVLILFLLKLFAGVLIGWMSQKFYPQGNDYWGLNDAGWKEYHLLMADPKKFFTEIFVSPYQNGYDGFFNSIGSYWNDLKNTLIGKLLAFCNILSRGNYYINSIFFNFAGFLGHMALYRVFADIYKGKKWPVIIGCFLLPSTLYFSAGIHKDLIVFSMLGLYCYALYFSLKNKLTAGYLITALLSFVVLLFIRNFVAMAIIPATMAYIIAARKKWNRYIVFAAVYSIGFIMLLLLQIVKPSVQPLEVITQKQRDFFDLPIASSQLNTHVLEPNIQGFVRNAPQAIDHALLRPYVWEPITTFLVPLSIELFIYELLFILMLFWYRKNQLETPFILFGLMICLPMLLLTGYIVPNIGSIVRYRSLYLPFLITPILCSINWGNFQRKKHIKI